jgi:hypothetical protein
MSHNWMKGHCITKNTSMKTSTINQFTSFCAALMPSLALPALIAVLSLAPVCHMAAQTFTTLHSFSAYPNYTNTDGAKPNGLVLSGNTASGGGSSDNGTVFSISFRPQLTITPAGVPPSGVILSWPTNVAGFDYTGYTLQTTTNPGAVWSTNSPAPIVVNGQNTVTNSITGLQRFYRLVQ